MKNLVALLVLVGAMGSVWGQIDNEFWFVAPEVISSHEDAPIRMRLATFDLPADVELDHACQSWIRADSSEHSRRWSFDP